MRIRSIKPEFWRSTDISDLSIEDRLLFIGLWSYVDDNGVGVFDVAIIAAELFAHDLSVDAIETLQRVSTGCKRLSEAGLVTLYEAEKRDLIFITNWEKHQRVNNPNKPRYPRPDAEVETLKRPYRDSKEDLTTGTGEQGNRGTEEQGIHGHSANDRGGDADEPSPAKKKNTYTTEFETWWENYPRKHGKSTASKAYAKALERTDSETLLSAVKAYAADPNQPLDQSKIPHASTWLNQDRWEDPPLPARGGSSTAADRRYQNVQALLEKQAQSVVQDYDPFAVEAWEKANPHIAPNLEPPLKPTQQGPQAPHSPKLPNDPQQIF